MENITKIINAQWFDNAANISSSMYFIVLAIFYGIDIVQNNNEVILTKKAGVLKTQDIFNILRIALLILPIIFFGKIGYLKYNNLCKKNYSDNKMGCWMNVLQKFFLMTYFIIVVIELAMLTANIDKEIMRMLIYIKLGFVSLLVLFSYALTYISYHDLDTSTILLFLALATLYLISFIASLNTLKGINNKTVATVTKYMALIMSIFLVILFMLQVKPIQTPIVQQHIPLNILNQANSSVNNNT